MASGSIMSSITEKYFKQFEIPVIPDEVQDTMTTQIQAYLEKQQFAFNSLKNASELFDKEIEN